MRCKCQAGRMGGQRRCCLAACSGMCVQSLLRIPADSQQLCFRILLQSIQQLGQRRQPPPARNSKRNHQSCRKKHKLQRCDAWKSISGGAGSTTQVPKCNPSKGSAASPSATQTQPVALFMPDKAHTSRVRGHKPCQALEASVGQYAHSHDTNRNRATMGWSPLAVVHSCR